MNFMNLVRTVQSNWKESAGEPSEYTLQSFGNLYTKKSKRNFSMIWTFNPSSKNKSDATSTKNQTDHFRGKSNSKIQTFILMIYPF